MDLLPMRNEANGIAISRLIEINSHKQRVICQYAVSQFAQIL